MPGNAVDNVVVIERVGIPAQPGLCDVDAGISQFGEIFLQELGNSLVSLLRNLRDCVVASPSSHWHAAFSAIGLYLGVCVFCSPISNLEHAVLVNREAVKAAISAMTAHIK